MAVAMNNSSSVTWKTKLKPGEKFEPSVSYQATMRGWAEPRPRGERGSDTSGFSWRSRSSRCKMGSSTSPRPLLQWPQVSDRRTAEATKQDRVRRLCVSADLATVQSYSDNVG